MTRLLLPTRHVLRHPGTARHGVARPWFPALVYGLIAYGLATVPARAAAPLVSATLEPRQISLGEAAQLTITSSGTGMEAITLPVVAGLEFRVIGQSRRVEIINGATLATTSVMVRVVPEVAGIFTIPGITPKSQPLVLRVNPDNGTAASPYSGNSTRPPVAANGVSASGIKMTADGAAFVQMNLPKRPVYVGESIPVDIEVGMRAGFVSSLNGLPTLTGGDFTLNNLSRQPERVEKLVDGQPFTVLTWHSVLAPVKPGSFTLAVESPLTIRVRTRPQRDSRIDDLLGDPFMQNFFGATVAKDITVSSAPAELTVLALPTEGRPANFSGAVGSFKIAAEVAATKAAVGDPLTLKMHVTGSGNFDRVDSAMLEHLDDWKTYPPKSAFVAGDAVGYKGEKTFEQPLIASKPGTQTLPALSFSYFDPGSHTYETARSTPVTVTIAAALADATPAAPETALTAAALPRAGSSGGSGLRADQPEREGTVHTLVPLYLQSRFLALPSLLVLALAGGWLGLRLRASEAAAPRKRRHVSASAARLLKQMDAAALARDPDLFFRSVRTALQDHWDARQIEHGVEAERIIAMADEASYSGRAMTAADFARWTEIVRDQLSTEVPA